jgi:hypothetical protein
MKLTYLLTSVFLCVSGVGPPVCANAQCTVPTPPTYTACGGSGQTQLKTAGTSIYAGNTYYYSATGGSIANVAVNGGTLYVCGTLILTSLTMYTGTIIIEPGGNLTINNSLGGSTSTSTPIVNRGSLTIEMATPTTEFLDYSSLWNYGTTNVEGSIQFTTGGDGLYNAATAASFIVSGSLLNDAATVDEGYMTIGGQFKVGGSGTLCMGPGSTLGVRDLWLDGSAPVTISPTGATATIGITDSLDTDGAHPLTNTTCLTLCAGPSYNNDGGQGDPGSAAIQNNCTLSVLAITLISFSASAENNICALQWTTAKQVGLVNFEIQSSTDAVNYETLATLPAEQETTDYSYTTALTANTWFRLKIVNQDSSFTYSAIVPVTYQGGAAGKAYVLRIQPNLITGNTLEVWSNMASAQSGEWQVVDMMGRTLMHQPVQLSVGTTTNNIQLPGLFSGMYHLLFISSQVKVSPVPFSVIR